MGRRFHNLKIRLSFIFNNKAITTHQWQKPVGVTVSDKAGHRVGSTPGLYTAWMEATPDKKGRYWLYKQHRLTYKDKAGKLRSRLFTREGVQVTQDGAAKWFCSKDEAVEQLKKQEKILKGAGYQITQDQPLRKHIYTNI